MHERTDAETSELDRLAEEFTEKMRAGEAPDIAAYVQSHPHLADAIQHLFPLLGLVEGAALDDEIDKPQTRTRSRIGDTIGDFRILREIGRGGMGVVYEAEQLALGRQVALKILPPAWTADERFVERFRLEAHAAARLTHPHLVPVIGYDRADELHFYAMRFVDGCGLDELIRAVGDLEAGRVDAESALFSDDLARRFVGTSVDGSHTTSAAAPTELPRHLKVGAQYYENAARLALHAAEAVAYAHTQGVLHRDIKPSNLMLDATGHVWVTDFGICKEAGTDGVTQTGDVLGSYRYMPPERFRGVSDARGDVYGLGITLYELLARGPAYEEQDRVALASAVVSGPPPRPRLRDSAIPADLETIVRTAMAHDSAQRYATADALASDLRAYMDRRPIAARAPTLGYTVRRAMVRHKAVTATALVALLALVAGGVFYVRGLASRERQVQAQRTETVRRQYAADIAAASAALQIGEPALAKQLLDAAPPEKRDWEWHYLINQSRAVDVTLPGPPDPASDMAMHPDRKHLAVGYHRAVWVYNVETREHIGSVPVPDVACSLAWRPDGLAGAVGGTYSLRLFRWPDGKLLWKQPHDSMLVGVAWSRGGTRVWAGLVDGWLVPHDASTGAPGTPVSVGCRVHQMRSNPQTGTLLVSGYDGSLALFNDAGTRVWRSTLSSFAIESVAYVGVDRVAAGTHEGGIHILDVATGEAIRQLAAGGRVACMDTSRDGRRLLAYDGRAVSAWDTQTGARTRTLARIGGEHESLVLIEDLDVVVLGARDGSIRVIEASAEDPHVLSGHMDGVTAVARDPDSRRIASGSIDGVVRVWEVDGAEQTHSLLGPTYTVTALAFGADERLAAGDRNGVVCVWSLHGDRRLLWVKAHDHECLALRFSDDGRLLTTASIDGVHSTWNIATGEQTSRHVFGGRWSQVAWTPDGAWMTAGTFDGTVQFISPNGTLGTPLVGHKSIATGLAFSPDGTLLIVTYADGTLQGWSYPSRELRYETATLNARVSHIAAIDAIAFTPNGRRFATGDRDFVVRVCHAEWGRPLLSLRTHRGWVHDLVFAHDGAWLASAHGNGQLQIWDTQPWVAAAPEATRVRRQADARARSAEDVDEVLAALSTRGDLSAPEREALRRALHRRRSESDEIRRQVRAFVETPFRRDTPEERAVLGTISVQAWALSHAADHLARQDNDAYSLYGALLCRRGQFALATLWIHRSRALNEQDTPERHASDLAFLAMARAGAKDRDGAAGALVSLEALWASQRAARTPRNQKLRAEAQQTVDELDK